MGQRTRLTMKQENWINQLFLCKFNQTEAAARAYNVSNRNVARTIGTENIAKPAIKREVERRLREQMDSKELKGEAGKNWLVDGLIQEIETAQRASDRNRSRELLMKHMGLLKDHHVQEIIAPPRYETEEELDAAYRKLIEAKTNN